MSKKKIAFLFGAGAEICFGLPSGDKYLKDTVLLNKDRSDYSSEDLGKALNSFFEDKYYGGLYKYQRNFLGNQDSPFISVLSEIIFQKLYDLKEKNDFARFNEVHYSFLSNSHISLLKERFKDFNINFDIKLNDENTKKQMIKYFKNFYFSTKDSDKNCNKLLNVIFESENIKVNYGGLLDSYFHTIINPKLYGSVKFSYVFNFYWSCYFSILFPLLKLKGKTSEYHNGNKIDILKILKNIKSVTKEIYEFDYTKVNNKNYYSELQNQIENNQKLECSGIITTNYSNISEQFLKCNTGPVSYPNGELRFFEIPENLEVIDLLEEELPENKLFFPFIFGQSFVKPIVNEYQIEQFSKMKKILKNADVLIIIGYGINSDDNHINSYLRKFVNNKKIVYMTSSKADDESVRISKVLHLENDSNLKCVTVNYGEIKNCVKRVLEEADKIDK